MSYYIRTHIPADRKIVTFPADLISSTFPAFLPEHHFYSCRTNKRYRVYQKKDSFPAILNDAVLHHYAKDTSGQEFYLLLSRNMFLFYKLNIQALPRFRDFTLEVCYYTHPGAFFPAGEDYVLLKAVPR